VSGNQQPEATSAAPPQPYVDTRIGLWWRVGIIVLALGGLGSGGAAVFITHLEAGPVALLGVGLVLILVGVGGRLPNRLKFGDNEAAWDAVEQFATRIAEDASPDSRPEVLDALTDLAQAAPRAAAPALNALAYIELVYSMLSSVLSELNVKYAETAALPDRQPPYRIMPLDATTGDLVVETPSGARLGIDISTAPMFLSPGAVTRANHALRAGSVAGFLFLMRGRVQQSILRAISDLRGPSATVVVESPADREDLASALASIFLDLGLMA